MNATEKVAKFSAWEIYNAVVNDSMRGLRPPTTEDIDRKFEAAFQDHLEEQGLTIVPIEPTEEMVLAVTDSWGWDVPLAFWKDMIAAYEKERENG